jgi:hypothetical protein
MDRPLSCATITRFRSSSARDHPAISGSVRRHPRQKPLRGSTTHILTQGEATDILV